MGKSAQHRATKPMVRPCSDLAREIAFLKRLGRGCKYCSTGDCFVVFANRLKDLERWRDEFRALPPDAQEQHLSLTFWHRPATDERLSGPGFCTKPQDRDAQTSEEESAHKVACQPAFLPTSSEEDDARIDTTPELSEEELDVACAVCDSHGHASYSSSAPRQPKKRRYSSGRRRQGRFSVVVCGQALCARAARALVGVGYGRLDRIKRGLADGRRDGTKGARALGKLPMTAPKTLSVLKFLWRLYQSVGEGMPDKFSFKAKDAKTLVLEASANGLCIQDDEMTEESVATDCSSEPDDALRDLDEEERSITAKALYAETSRHPAESVLHGPGMLSGPLRYLPPTKRVHLYWEYVAWCQSQGYEAASFATFLRVFQASRNRLRIRKAGEHAKCDICMKLKAHVRKQVFPKDRQAAIEAYTRHILDQWLDRQVSHLLCILVVRKHPHKCTRARAGP